MADQILPARVAAPGRTISLGVLALVTFVTLTTSAAAGPADVDPVDPSCAGGQICFWPASDYAGPKQTYRNPQMRCYGLLAPALSAKNATGQVRMKRPAPVC
jgi:hypothetical protein